MEKFNQWVEKRSIAESDIHNPMSTKELGENALISGLRKLKNGLDVGEMPNGYTGHSVIANKFGLSPEETSVMLRHGIISTVIFKDEQGSEQRSTDINKIKLDKLLNLMDHSSSVSRRINAQTR